MKVFCKKKVKLPHFSSRFWMWVTSSKNICDGLNITEIKINYLERIKKSHKTEKLLKIIEFFKICLTLDFWYFEETVLVW